MKIKIKENKQEPSLDSAQYTLTFQGKDRGLNYKILNTLIGDKDMVIEINSSRFSNTVNNPTEYTKKILNFLRENELAYNYQKVPDNSSQSIFTSLFKKDRTAHEVLFYLPNKIWQSASFKSLMPIPGARYYIRKKSKDEKDTLKNMQQLMDDELLDYFSLIIFDPGVTQLKQMGINSRQLTADNLRELFK
ncbi:hypothetical protein [Halocella sp. SP3-1]|uniref:hypothetical protein n=1 Tax=Halocella sp. SP3-1 TaxID=2382161 RepID=UPI000F75CA09|nr:hypothetical protein [Halocella sp. SP3-1]AZO94705.1 hypothetical protein D7D81_08930 [Halocella sp. SP3-1]